jgi:hypothetical protein
MRGWLQVTGLVVGKKGVKINQIKQRSKAHVELSKDVLPSDNNLKRLTIKGTKDELKKAEGMIYELLLKWCDGEGSEENFVLLPLEVQRRLKEFESNQEDGEAESAYRNGEVTAPGRGGGDLLQQQPELQYQQHHQVLSV